MTKKRVTYKGRPIDTLTREELIEALELAVRQMEAMRRGHMLEVQTLASLRRR